jgi:hypothetical protein
MMQNENMGIESNEVIMEYELIYLSDGSEYRLYSNGTVMDSNGI